MTLYPYQQRVNEALSNGRNVILQAPTGSGKTRAALSAFLMSRNGAPDAFPRQCIYAVPVRVLADQFAEDAKQEEKVVGVTGALNVSVQTGSRPEDTRFEGDLIFATIDQLLSNFLTIPYSLSNRQANLNAGAVIGSYLVFDEFHLFPVDDEGNGALATTLQMLQMLKGITPFVLMTATFSTLMLKKLCKLLDAEAVTLSPDEVATLRSQQGKERRYRYTAKPLTAEAVIDDFLAESRQRAIAVCNTVARAQELAETLRNDPRLAGVCVELLHSRFYASDRAPKEGAVRREFGEDRGKYTWGPTILVATQVIEVGLNLTCEVLHTELAPAAAIVQRAGRCARFTGEKGTVLIYDVPLTNEGRPNYAPYGSAEPQRKGSESDSEGGTRLCERTQEALAAFPANGKLMTYHNELDLVNDAHREADERLLERLRENRSNLRNQIERVFGERERSAARELIRDIDNCTVIVHDNPTPQTVPNPYAYEGISLRRSTLYGWYSRVQATAHALALDWIIQLPVQEKADDAGGDEGGADSAEQRRRVETHWQAFRPGEKCVGLGASGVVVVHPALVAYDCNLGFRLLEDAEMSVDYRAANSPPAQRKRDRVEYGPIRRETYAEHIAGLYRVYTHCLHDQTAAVRHRLEERDGLPFGLIDRVIRLMFAIHDLGKLDQTWQQWAHRWQDKVSELCSEDLRIAADYMAAHTDYDAGKREQRDANRAITPRRPPHAAESARAGSSLLNALAGEHETLYVAAMTAIICHHSAASVKRFDHGPWQPAAAARTAFNEALRCVDMSEDEALVAVLRERTNRIDWTGFSKAADLSEDLVQLDRTTETILYLMLARVLRLCDQGSQDPAG